MGAWELGQVRLEMRKSADDDWTPAPASWEVDVGGSLDYRMAFTIVNGDDVINTGEMQLEKRTDGGDWADVAGESGKFMQPGYILGIEAHPPDWKAGTVTHRTEDAGALVEYRAFVHWDTDGYSSLQGVQVSEVDETPEDLTDAGELAEFFRFEDFGDVATITGDHARTIRGIFNDPSALALRIQGHRPTLLCERDLVVYAKAGDPIAIGDRSFILRGKHHASELTLLVLEEAA